MKYILLTSFFFSLILTAAHSQQSTTTLSAEVEEFLPITEKKVTPLKKAQRQIADSYGQYYKRLPGAFTGYVIDLLKSERPLAREHELFQQFGNVYYDKLPDGTFAYCIVADNFTSVQSLERYIENMISHRAPAATVVEYKNGKRKAKAKDKNCCPGLDKM